MKKYYLITLIGIIIDRVVKILVENFISNDIVLIKNFFYLTFTKNDGAAFSMLGGARFFFIAVSIIVLILLFLYIRKTNTKNIGIYMLIGGIVGNLIDRLFFGYVIDYLGFILFGKYMPIFNFADILIVIGTFIILIGSEKNEIKSN